MVRTIFAQPDAETVQEQYRRIVDQLETRFPEASREALTASNPRVDENSSVWRDSQQSGSWVRLLALFVPSRAEHA